MPRPRKLTLSISDLKCFKTLKSELESISELKGFDIDAGQLIFKETYTFKVRPKNIENAIERLIHFIENTKSQQIFVRQDLADLLGISRPTLDKWIEKRVIMIDTIPTYQLRRPTFLFSAKNAQYILEDLRNYLTVYVYGEETDLSESEEDGQI